jgi:hypothetical protein
MSTYITLYQTLVKYILDIWILDSVARNRNHPHIHLLPFSILTKEKALRECRSIHTGPEGLKSKDQKIREIEIR